MLTRDPDELRADLAAQKRRWRVISKEAGVSYDALRRFVSGDLKRPGWGFLMALDKSLPRRVQ